MRLIFLGPPGAGKGTQARRLVEYLQVPHISTGDMLRQAIRENSEIGRQSEEYIKRGDLVPDPIVLELVSARLARPDCRRGWLLDGFPRTLGQARALDRFLAEHGLPLDGVLELQVDREELLRRLRGRQRADDEPAVVRQRLDTYLAQTAPLSEYYRQRGLQYPIDGHGSPDEVFARIQAVLKQMQRKAEPSSGA